MISMRKPLLLSLMAGMLCTALNGAILKVEIEGVIDPITSEFITSSVSEAEAAGAEFLLIRLATPGGLGISMQEIVQSILNSKVPIVCYVAPQGAHAASAGFFILLAADVAAMAPGTNTGAAHPVFPFGMENQVMLEKVRNDALASLRAIVQQRNRNYELAEKGVLESKSYTAAEALEGRLIDLIAESEADLLRQLDRREITRFSGEKQTLKTEGVEVRQLEMTARQRLLSTIADPNFALILGVIGLLGLYFEFTHPGLILPGVIGGICLLLAALGFSLLPVNLIGVLLILLAVGLLIAEVKVQGFGVLGFGGIVALILGIVFLIDSPYPELRIDLGLAVAVAIPFALIFLFLLRLVIRSHRSRVTTGQEGLIGEIGIARTDIGPDPGWVLVAGERWRATSAVPIRAGSRVRVVGASKLELAVEEVTAPVRSSQPPL
jgi:membrane-bound serine protease (ClpP class)